VRSAFAAFSLVLALFCVTATGASAFSLDSYPFQQQGEPLTSPDVTELAEQGYSVALSANGDTALVGSPDYKESTSEVNRSGKVGGLIA
jgi:hypothetical protein